jgi:hypothetical protein
MKKSLSWLLAGFLLLGCPGCIYVRVTGDLDEEFWGDEDDQMGFHELDAALEGCLADPAYDLDLETNPWHTEAVWTVRYAGAGSDGPAAFHKAKEAVLKRIEREGGQLTEQRDDGPHAWSCSFRIDDEPGEASVELLENAGEDDERPHQLEVSWEESD